MVTVRTPRASSRDDILRVFAEHVARKGYSDTSLSEIATVLGLSKGTIVHHFGNKERMLHEVHSAYYERRFAEAEFIHRELDDPLTQLAAIVYALLAAHRDDRAATIAFLREFVRYAEGGGLSEELRGRRIEYRDMVVAIIERGVAGGVFHSSDPGLSALHIFGMCNYAWTWYRPEGAKSIEEIATFFASDVLLGLCGARSESLTDVDEAISTAIATVIRTPNRLPPEPPAAS
ncbi:TetR family transcriptional regulator [Streptomyces albipurpureus]|uniref:TetR/AcrR family transcriptional regulator n=1 Tax=Streptomyces albipurpureus TaxID=2897419 RepID=A0ABT0UGY4_9ACTN|nr:TetR family transcriptional regulator [Streptomyces sp. CWNU-1]MCM2387571.1 TetR/AcrR family transcriptional regulator [Streptomyces sp. CWNU-1]